MIKKKLWIPIVVGMIACAVDYSSQTRAELFILTILVIGIYYFSELMGFLRFLVISQKENKRSEKQEGENV